MSSASERYYVPHNSYWPIVGSIGLALLFVGFARMLTGAGAGGALVAAGALTMVLMLAGWFGTIIRENESGATIGRWTAHIVWVCSGSSSPR